MRNLAEIVDKAQRENMASMLKTPFGKLRLQTPLLLEEPIGVLLKDSRLFRQTNWTNRAFTFVGKDCHTG
jgi:hypothetical protein